MTNINTLFTKLHDRIEERDEWNDNNDTFLSDKEYAKAQAVLDILYDEIDDCERCDILERADDDIEDGYAFFKEICDLNDIDIADIVPEQFCLALIALE